MKFLRLYTALFVFFSVSCDHSLYELAHPQTRRTYSQAAINYFQEIGFGSEFGKNDSLIIRKWELSRIRVGLYGNYTKEDESELRNIISDLSKLTGLSFEVVHQNPGDIDIHFIPQSHFSSVISEYDPKNSQDGFFYVLSDERGVIYKATILLKEDARETLKKHLLREEFTQCMGIMKDSDRKFGVYANSIFQQDSAREPIVYSSIDKDVIRLLYDSRVRAGMTEQEFLVAVQASAVA